MWLHSPRVVSVETVECAPSPETLANRLAALDQANSDVDFLLFLELPFGVGSPSSTRFGFDKDAQKQSQSWRENVEKALSLLRERDDTTDWNRWRHALAWWLPRVATASEWESAREATAQNQLLHDPQLADNARGRSVLAHLREGLAARENMLSQLGARLLREGALANGGGLWIEAGELALGENWASSLEAVAQWVLPELFPRFAEVAPRLRVLSPSSVDALCLETLRRPTQTPFFAASLERSVRAIAQPLGMAQESGGRWLIGSPTSARCELARDFFAFFDERGASLSWLETALSKGIWGLNALQTRLLACAFLHSGEIVAFDARGRALAPAEIGLPLSRSVHVLRAGLLPDEDIWQKLQEIAQLLTGENRLERSFENQEKTRALLTNWRDETVAQSELAQARLHQWQRVSPQNASAERARESLNATVQTLQDAAFSPVVDLARVALLPPEIVRQDLESWRVVTQKLETHHAPLLEHWSFLRHADLVAPIEMAESRQDLLSRFDGFLDDETLLRDATNWRIEYSNRYAKWHNAQHASERFAPFLRLLESDTARVLSRLATIQTRDFPFAAQLQSAVHIELQKACRRDGTLAGEPVCTSCRLAFGGSLTLRDAREIETVAQNGIAVFRQSLREESVRALVENSEIGAPLLGWNQENGDANALLPILTREAALLLEDAFRPRRRVSRSWQELQSSTRSCRTKSDWQRAFALWLEGAENPGDDDEIEIAE